MTTKERPEDRQYKFQLYLQDKNCVGLRVDIQAHSRSEVRRLVAQQYPGKEIKEFIAPPEYLGTPFKKEELP